MKINEVDIEEFGRDVERLCDFLLDSMGTKTGSNSQRIIEDIQAKAVNLQLPTTEGIDLDGLEAHMKGIPQ